MYRVLIVWLLTFLVVTPTLSFDWPSAEPMEVGVDESRLKQLDQQIRVGNYGQVNSILVLRHGKLIHESYFDARNANSLLPLYSATKSWASALIGAALRTGELESVETPIDRLLPTYEAVFAAAPAKRNITLHDLLTMRHGLDWDEWSTFFVDPENPVYQMVFSLDWWGAVLNRPVTAAPDTVFRYSTGASNLLGGVIYEQLGLSADEFAAQVLFEPMAISQRYYEVDLSGGPRGTGITAFPQGLTPTGHGLWLTARDLAKLGQLYLDDGVWQTKRLVDRSWVGDSWRDYSNHATDPSIFPAGLSYGYQWWAQQYATSTGSVEVHFAWGFGDQFVFVAPELDLVVVSTATNGNYEGPTIRSDFANAILEAIGDDFDPVSDAGMTGSWYSPGLQNQGLMLEVVPSTGQLVAYWMTFEPDSNQQMWLYAVGKLQGRRAVLQFRRPEGGTFSGSSEVHISPWAEAELIFLSCTQATLKFTADASNVQGTIDLVRITPVTSCS